MTSFIVNGLKRRLLTGALSVIALTLTQQGQAFATSYDHEVTQLNQAKPKDRTLFELRAGLAGFSEGNIDAAKKHFDAALDAIESVYSNTENAARARSLWYEEGAKDFKGEPYERAMAFYYRGLIYLIDGDSENARASFRSGLIQSSFAEEQQYRSGFATLMFLEGWADQLLGDRSQRNDAYAEVRKYRPDWQPPPDNAKTLVIAELGGSPRKLGDGVGNYEIVYRRPKRTPEKIIQLKPNDLAAVVLYPIEDLYIQATHRGDREIDKIIDGKVKFQENTAAVGSALGTLASEGSLINAGVGGHAGNALGAISAVGAITSLLAINAKPQADVRYWNNLPETLHIATIQNIGLVDPTKITLFDDQGSRVNLDNLITRQWTDSKGNQLIWIKSRN
jgi:tetratricopeptide (TPR) repeat protein